MVLQELGQARDTPDDIIFDHLQGVIYRDQPLGWPILGEEATVNRLRAAGSARAMPAARYRADAMTLVSSGAVSHRRRSWRMAEEKFAALANRRRRADASRRAMSAAKSGWRRISSRRISPMPFPASPRNDPDFYAAQLYAMVLGGGMSSRLFQEVREKRGLCYSIYAFTNNFQDTGFTGIYAGTGEKEAGELSARDRGRNGSHDGPDSARPNWRAPRRSSNPAC